MARNWRGNYNVLVPQADSMGAIAVIRSLGQHGYNIFAVSADPNALGCRSSFITEASKCPQYGENYLNWLRSYIETHKIHVIIPSEDFYLIIKDDFSEFSHLIPVSSSKKNIYLCLSKADVFASFLRSCVGPLNKNIPNTQIVASENDVCWQEIKHWRYPLFIKGDGFYSNFEVRASVISVGSEVEARQAIKSALQGYKKVLIQDCCKGVKATVNLLFQEGRLLAESMVIATHESPNTGGLTSLRHSWWHQDMYEDAVVRLRHLNWNGPAMVEYKWDKKNNNFTFIELNSRYWAALNLDILAGVHFPCIHLDYFFAKMSPKEPIRLEKPIKVRNALPADFGYMLSSIKDRKVSKVKKVYIILEFFLLFIHPKIKADLLYPNDRKLYFINLRAFIKDFCQSCLRRLK
ncbi:hypothetical protein [Colwellia psychrerythraea]|uniref:ATP-grasp domain-containing protein n=1 Tax=Colwellia psychrerythraea TaxID=28229 RepID=A0A099L1C2_COLPS|nr:hypothetical protein [Colwellia psychrerythraea]KGJ96784.1 hypothetical protein GAB14E_1660 [Colwellia psychrerythraea]